MLNGDVRMLVGTVTFTVTDAAGGETTLILGAATDVPSVEVGFTVSVQLTTIPATAIVRNEAAIARERKLRFIMSPANSGKYRELLQVLRHFRVVAPGPGHESATSSTSVVPFSTALPTSA